MGLARNGPSGGVARTVEWPRGAYREGLLDPYKTHGLGTYASVVLMLVR